MFLVRLHEGEPPKFNEIDGVLKTCIHLMVTSPGQL